MQKRLRNFFPVSFRFKFIISIIASLFMQHYTCWKKWNWTFNYPGLNAWLQMQAIRRKSNSQLWISSGSCVCQGKCLLCWKIKWYILYVFTPAATKNSNNNIFWLVDDYLTKIIKYFFIKFVLDSSQLGILSYPCFDLSQLLKQRSGWLVC